MKRPPGVIVSAILLLLIALLELLAALGMGLAGAVLSSQGLKAAPQGLPGQTIQPWVPAVEYAMAGFSVALAAWGIATMVGLFQMRRWARYSILVIGGGMAVIGLFSMLGMLVMLFVPMPLPQTGDPSQEAAARMAVHMAFGVITLLYGMVFGLGVFWLVYFNLKKVREAFAGAAGAQAESPRPFLIAVIAVLCLIGAPICVAAAFLPFPATLLGFTLHGAAKTALYLAVAAVDCAAGVGLWRLREWGRRLELAFLGLGIVNCLVYLVRPSLATRANGEIYRTMGITQPTLPPHFLAVVYSGTFGLSTLLMAAMIAVLYYYRGRFKGPDETQLPGPAAAV